MRTGKNQKKVNNRPKLYIHVGQATHFLRWELAEFNKHFTLVTAPSMDVLLLSFGPDVLEEASVMPARARFAVLFPGFRHNPLYDLLNRERHIYLIKNFYTKVFINPGPLELAYVGLSNIELYPFSIDTSLVGVRHYRSSINSLLHVSSDSPQKDWRRSQQVMKNTGLDYEVYPPRLDDFHKHQEQKTSRDNKIRSLLLLPKKRHLPYGYVDHKMVVKKYQEYDGFVHVARDIKNPEDGIDGKYTASLIEAGLTGAILFWHDTYNLGNGLETVFSLPLDPKKAAEQIMSIRSSINIREHSRRTHEEMIDVFNPQRSVEIRALKMLESI